MSRQFINGAWVWLQTPVPASVEETFTPPVVNATKIDGVEVEVTSTLADGRALVYDSSTNTFHCEDIASGSGNATQIDNVTVEVTSTLADKRALVYDSGTTSFKCAEVMNLTGEQSAAGTKHFTESITVGTATLQNNPTNSIAIGQSGVTVSSDTCFAFGHVDGNGIVRAGGNPGCVAMGAADAGGLVESTNQGAFALAFAGTNGRVRAWADGAWASGHAVGNTTSKIEATGTGSFARGSTSDGNITASGEASFASGSTHGGSVSADNFCAFTHGFSTGSGKAVIADGEVAVAFGHTEIDSVFVSGNASMGVGSDITVGPNYSIVSGCGAQAIYNATGQMATRVRASGRFTSGTPALAQAIDGMVLRARTTDTTPTEALGGPNLDKRLVMENRTTVPKTTCCRSNRWRIMACCLRNKSSGRTSNGCGKRSNSRNPLSYRNCRSQCWNGCCRHRRYG